MFAKTKICKSLPFHPQGSHLIVAFLIFYGLLPGTVDSFTCNLSAAQCLAEYQNTTQSLQYTSDCFENTDNPGQSFSCVIRCRTGGYHACRLLCLQKGFVDYGVYCDQTTSTPTLTVTTSSPSTSRSTTTHLSRDATKPKRAIVDRLEINKAPKKIIDPTTSTKGADQTDTKFIVICIFLVCVSAVCAVMTGLYVKLRKKIRFSQNIPTAV